MTIPQPFRDQGRQRVPALMLRYLPAGIRRFLIFTCLLLPALALAQDFTSQFPYHKKTEYFDFYYRRESPKISEIARFADGFVRLVNRDFFKADFDYPIRVLVFENREQFKGFLTQQLHIADPPNFGVYVFQYKFFATYEDSGLGTFAHEILHPLVERNLKDRPGWAMEGIPTFFEKFYGYWQDGELKVNWGYQNPWRIQQLAGELARLNLEHVLADPTDTAASSVVERSESGWRMASVFLWRQGRFNRFLSLIAKRDKAGYPTYFEAAMELPMTKILPLWQSYLDDTADHRPEISILPVSTILNNQADFENFVKSNHLSLVQPAKHN